MNSLLNFLRDPIWQGVSALVAIVAFLYFLYDRYVTKEHVINLRKFIVRTFWTAAVWLLFSGFITGAEILSDKLYKKEISSNSYIGGWLSTGLIFTIVTVIVQIQEDKKKK